MAFIFTDGESEAFADSKGYDIHGWGDNVPDDEIHSRYLFDDDSEFINNLVSIKSGGKFTNKLDTYTFVSEDSNGVCTYDVLKVYPRDDYSRKYQAKLQLIQK